MGVGFKDYYEIIGVPRSASQEDIHRAYRKLAMKYHPDVAKDKALAEEKFKELNEAHEVLKDPENRKKYDALGANWKQGQEFHPPPDWQEQFRGQHGGEWTTGDSEVHFSGTGYSDFFESLFGVREGGMGSASRGGIGGSPFSKRARRGRDVEAGIMVTLEEALRGSTRNVSLQRAEPCDHCARTGRVEKRTCPQCGGKRQVVKTETYEVKIPVGVCENQILRLSGRGESGSLNGQSGDLFLRVHFASHPNYRTENNELYHDLDIAPWDAVLGATVSVPLLNERADLKIPPGTQTGRRLRMRGKGLPKPGGACGDLYIVVNIKVPEQLGERERTLWEQLRRESSSDPGRGSHG